MLAGVKIVSEVLALAEEPMGLFMGLKVPEESIDDGGGWEMVFAGNFTVTCKVLG